MRTPRKAAIFRKVSCLTLSNTAIEYCYLRFNRESPIITVFARIEGEKTRRIKVALDTGATFVMIPWEVAEILDYNSGASPKKRKIITASGIQHVPLVVLRSMSVLEMEAHNGSFSP